MIAIAPEGAQGHAHAAALASFRQLREQGWQGNDDNERRRRRHYSVNAAEVRHEMSAPVSKPRHHMNGE